MCALGHQARNKIQKFGGLKRATGTISLIMFLAIALFVAPAAAPDKVK